MQYQAVKSFICSLAHREKVEVAASVHSHGGTTAITYSEPLTWPWPQQFNYTTEFFCSEQGAVSFQEIQEVPAKSNHVVNLFAQDPERESAPFQENGYTIAWVSPLLGRALSAEWVRPIPEGIRIHEVMDMSDMRRYSSVQGISNQGIARDAAIHNFFATDGSQVIAKGQLILLPGSMAYISDMFCVPTHRRKGLCHAIMRTLEDKARLLGATHACLAPGYEVMAYHLYAKYGYEKVASRAVLISFDKRDVHSPVAQ